MRRWLMVVGLVSTLVTGTAAYAQPRLPARNPDRLVTVVSLGGDATYPTSLTGKAYGPDVPLAIVSVGGGYLEADNSIGCSFSVQQTLYWTIDAGNGDVLHGQLLSGGGGLANASPTVTFLLKATGGTGRFAGWSGWGSYTAYGDAFCGLDFDGVWKINRV